MSPKEIQNSFFLTLMHYSGVFNTTVVLVNYSNMHAILILGTVSNHESALYSLYQIWVYDKEQHCNPLQGNYRVELLHREIPVIITGNEFAE